MLWEHKFQVGLLPGAMAFSRAIAAETLPPDIAPRQSLTATNIERSHSPSKGPATAAGLTQAWGPKLQEVFGVHRTQAKIKVGERPISRLSLTSFSRRRTVTLNHLPDPRGRAEAHWSASRGVCLAGCCQLAVPLTDHFNLPYPLRSIAVSFCCLSVGLRPQRYLAPCLWRPGLSLAWP